MRTRAHSATRRRATTFASVAVGLAALATVTGCNEARPPFSIEVVTAQGGNPVAGASTGRLRVLVAQDGQPTRDQGVDLVGGTFQLDVTIASYATPTRLGVELVRDGATSIGAVPAFAPVGFPFVRVPVVPVGTCASLGTQRLATPRSGAALVSIDALLLTIGGLDGAGAPASDIERFTAQLLTASEGSGTPLGVPVGVGRARAARVLTTERIFVVGAARSVVLDLSSAAPSLVSDATGLHAGAGERSALVQLSGNGLALVGGVGAAAVSWMALDGNVTTSVLPDPREGAAASAWGSAEGVLVAGGNGDGASTFLFVPSAPSMRGDVREFGPTEDPTRQLEGGAVVRAPDGSAALYVGAVDVVSGEVVQDTWLVTGCPARCTVSDGPRWERARTGFAFAATDGGAWLVGGRVDGRPSSDVERVRWSGSVPSFVEASLVVPRDDAAITPLAGGLVLVGGGRGDDRALEDLELCAPDALEAL